MRPQRNHARSSFIATCICISIVAGIARPSSAQDFDLEPSDVPVWEALERYRDNPLCLRSVTATGLTVLPGISLRTAHRIVNIVTNRSAGLTFEHIADSACLSVEQMIVLASCTTLDCSSRPFLQSAWARLRDRDGRTSVRADVVTNAGRIGAVFDAEHQSTPANDSASSATFSGWLSTLLDKTTVHLGAMRVGAGMGLMLGGSGRFGSSVSARAGSLSQAPSARAHTSSYIEGAFNGLAIHYTDTSLTALAGYSRHNVERNERAFFAAAQHHDIGVGVLALDYNASSQSRAGSVVRTSSLVSASLFGTQTFGGIDLRGEVVLDNTLASAVTLVAHSIARGRAPRWSCGVRHFSSDYHAPYASSISDASYINNEYGAFVAADVRLNTWALSATLDMHGSLSPRYGSPLPTRGFDLLLAAVSRTLDVRARYERDTEGWRPPGDAFTRMRTRTRLSLRAEASMNVTRHVRVRTRIDTRIALFSFVKQDSPADQTDHGWATFVEAQWQATSWISARVRFTLFNAQSIDVAPYFVETDALGAMRTVACSGEGSRMHIALRFNPVAFATLSASIVCEERTTDPSRPLSGLLQLDIRLPQKP